VAAVSAYFVWADFSIVGLACDVAGAVVLALSFSVKRPERIREEVPQSITTGTTVGFITVPFPQALAESMARQRAEARLGMVFLVAGFAMQATVYFFEPASHLSGLEQQLAAGALILAAWVIAFVGWRLCVPLDEWRTLRQLGDGIPPYRNPLTGRTLETRAGHQQEIGERPPPALVRFARWMRSGLS
jgi:hypothetical protein